MLYLGFNQCFSYFSE